MTARRAMALVNARSRSGEAAKEHLVEALRASGMRLIIPPRCEPCDVSSIIEEHAAEVDCVIVGGGDGTMHAAAPGLLKTGLPFGIIPLGTGNDLAKTLGIPPDLDGAIRIIVEDHTRKIDVGLVNGCPFFNVASIGLSTALTNALRAEDKRRLGRVAYVLAAMRVLSRARPFRAVIRGERESVTVRTLQIAVGNGRYYGGGNAVAKEAAIDDGKLHLYSIEFLQAWKLALMARSFRLGEHVAHDEVRALTGEFFEVRAPRPLAVNADGELVTHTPARFEVRPNAVEVYTPAVAPPDAGLNEVRQDLASAR